MVQPPSTRSPQVGEPQVKAIFDLEDKEGFLYTVGVAATHPAHVEFLYFNCPREDVKEIVVLMSFLGQRLREGHLVCDGQLVGSRGKNYLVFGVPKKVNDALLESHATQCCGAATLLVLAPLASIPFSITADGGVNHTFVASGRMAFHVEREKLTSKGPDKLMFKSITDKWNNRGGFFFRNLSGNWMDVNVMNYQIIPISVAMLHPEWAVDWDNDLTQDEVAFVRANMGVFAELYKPLHDPSCH